MKKAVLIVALTLFIICIVLGSIYAIDMNRMKNNEPVFFCTWGRKYSPPLKESTRMSNEILAQIENEKEKQAVYNKNSDYLALSIPNDWEFEEAPKLSDMYRGGIKIYPKNSEGYVTVYCADWFGVCGTGLKVEKIFLNNGVEMEVGYYNNSEEWEYAYFEDDDIKIVSLNKGLKGEESKEAIQILKSIEYKSEN